MFIAKSSLSRYDLKKVKGNIIFLDKVMADFVYSKWLPTFKSKMANKVSGLFEFLKLTVTLFGKKILPWSFFKSYILKRSLQWARLNITVTIGSLVICDNVDISSCSI